MAKDRQISFVGSRRFWLGMAGAAMTAGAGLAYYLRNKDEIDFYVRVYGAKQIADKFYAEYPHLTKNIAYGSGPTQRLDVYRPENGTEYPVFVYVHGGSWSSGNKKLYSPMAQRLMPEGMIVVVVGYTLYPEANCRQQVSEVSQAIAWVLEHIAEYGGDPKRVIIGAQSSGAHIASLALYDPQWLAAVNHRLAEIAGFIGISGVYDIEAQAGYSRSAGYAGEFFDQFFGDDLSYGPASPLRHVRPGLPPALLIHGDADRTVPVGLSERFHAALQTAGVSCRYVVYEKSGHAQILFDALASNPARLVNDMVMFVNECPPVSH